jgi:hypothetical protein
MQSKIELQPKDGKGCVDKVEEGKLALFVGRGRVWRRGLSPSPQQTPRKRNKKSCQNLLFGPPLCLALRTACVALPGLRTQGLATDEDSSSEWPKSLRGLCNEWDAPAGLWSLVLSARGSPILSGWYGALRLAIAPERQLQPFQ